MSRTNHNKPQELPKRKSRLQPLPKQAPLLPYQLPLEELYLELYPEPEIRLDSL